MQLSSLILSAVVGLAGFQGAPRGGPITIDSCVVRLIEEAKLPADLPSQEAGVLITLRMGVVDADNKRLWGNPVRAGMPVSAGQVLGQIDNRMSQKMREVAEHKLAIAIKEAGNEVSVKYAKAAYEVAIADYESEREANRTVPGTITKTELRRLLLSCKQFELQAEQAEYELQIADISVLAQRAQLEAANIDLARRDIISPIDGVIIEVFPHEGEWLRPGDPIVHIVGMKQLWVEGRLDSTKYSPVDVANRPVGVLVAGQTVFPGKIDFVSPMVDGDKHFKVRAIVQQEPDKLSGQWLLRPGMETSMTIK